MAERRRPSSRPHQDQTGLLVEDPLGLPLGLGLLLALPGWLLEELPRLEEVLLTRPPSAGLEAPQVQQPVPEAALVVVRPERSPVHRQAYHHQEYYFA